MQEKILEHSEKVKEKENIIEPNLFEEKPRKKGKKWLFLILIGIGICLFIIFSPERKIEGEAVLKSDHLVQIGTVTSGILKELIHKKGDSVKEGEILARFENAEIRGKLAEKQIALEILNYGKTELVRKKEFVQKEKERKNLLFENGVIGRALLEQADLDLSHASESIGAKAKEIEASQNEITFLKEKLQTLEIKAPFSGVILNDLVEKLGNYFKEGETIFDFVDPSTFYLELLVPEKDIEKLKVGDSAKITFRTVPSINYVGEITNMGPKTEQEIEKVFKIKHVVPVRIKLSEIPEHARYGMRAWVQIKPDAKARSDLWASVQTKLMQKVSGSVNRKDSDKHYEI